MTQAIMARWLIRTLGRCHVDSVRDLDRRRLQEKSRPRGVVNLLLVAQTCIVDYRWERGVKPSPNIVSLRAIRELGGGIFEASCHECTRIGTDMPPGWS